MPLTQDEFNRAILHLVQRLAKEVRGNAKRDKRQTLIETQQELQDLETQLPEG